jgi:hypothetical protein
MSTQQPSGATPPEGPGYAQPQDPWEGYEPGLASVPTDPIPQQYEPYGHGQAYPHSDVWSQATVAQGGYAAAPATRGRRTGTVVLIVLAVLLLGGGGGFAAWYITTQRSANGVTPTSDPTGPVTSAATTGNPTSAPAVAFDPHTVEVDQCIQNNGTQSNPDVSVVPCDTDSSYKVIRIVTGDQIVEAADGTFDRDTTSVAACQGTNYRFWYAYQDPFDDAKDVFFCMVAST